MSANITRYQHGVMVVWQQTGLLITGQPGVGKSSLALALIELGGQLVADDCIDIVSDNDWLTARCPPKIIGLLHHRELGLLDIRAMFGSDAFCPAAKIDAVISLSLTPTALLDESATVEMLAGKALPKLSLTVSNPLPLPSRVALWLKSRSNPTPEIAGSV
ncbi:serine kinase of the HPr protein() [Methylophaga frappieri]|uniref:Serine kinase of the HPr protein() n=1 Tax=Methylophaga frappieri (strain ATCC BAA-2434 / DSM 25690 / JAM7) TaxID=754477 RepID=I1YIV2_METFJ|nr:serine kinase of the HPr protein() [Methylophaga frappieri]AFJ02845.1 serine kinase of the HPr protein() [Methylophaga frappieri]